jgi:uncharacterized protein YkwD
MKKLFVILSILISSVGYATEPTDTFKTESADIEFLEKLVLKKISEYRVSNGVKYLVWDDTLGKGSRDHSEWMVKNNKFEHAKNINSLGECIIITSDGAGICTYDKVANFIVNGWKESPGHNAILLQKWDDIGGIGVSFEEGEYMYSIYTTFRISSSPDESIMGEYIPTY